MKKLFTLLFVAFAGVCACFAEDEIDETFVFVNEAGEVVKNDSVLTITGATETPSSFKYMLNSGLFVKNTSMGNAVCAIAYNVEELPSGAIQLCFPENCFLLEEPCYDVTGKGKLLGGETKDLQTEWMTSDYGTAKVTYQIMVYEDGPTLGSFVLVGTGPTVTVNYVCSETSAINDVVSGVAADEVARYSLDGRVLT